MSTPSYPSFSLCNHISWLTSCSPTTRCMAIRKSVRVSAFQRKESVYYARSATARRAAYTQVNNADASMPFRPCPPLKYAFFLP